MNIKDLKKLTEDNQAAQIFLRWLHTYPLSLKTLGASVAEVETRLDYYDVISTLKSLDAIGAGKFIVGRKGRDSRMSWFFDTRDIGKLAFGELVTIKDLNPVPEDSIDHVNTETKAEREPSMKHTFNLRQDFQVALTLPKDLNEREVTRLKNWLDLLVI